MKKEESERLVAVETNQKHLIDKVDALQKDVKAILVNHFPHIKEELAELRTGMAVSKVKVALITGGVGIVVATAITIIVTRLLG